MRRAHARPPHGYLAAGAFAAIIRQLIENVALTDAVRTTIEILRHRPHHEETTNALTHALDLARSGTPTPQKVESVGGGWIAEQALAIGLAQHGSWALPLDWTGEVEGQETIWNRSVAFAHELSDHPLTSPAVAGSSVTRDVRVGGGRLTLVEC